MKNNADLKNDWAERNFEAFVAIDLIFVVQ